MRNRPSSRATIVASENLLRSASMFSSPLPRSGVNWTPACQNTRRVSVMLPLPATWSNTSQTDSKRPWLSDEGDIR